MMQHRVMPVPEGLLGERADTAISRLLGFSRSFAAEVLDADGVSLDGVTLNRSTRLRPGLLEINWTRRKEPTVVPEKVADFAVLHADDDLVVIDKPVGVAAHPSPGWTGPTVLGALAAAGFRISTSGAPERQGIVHRLDVGTSGVMMVATSELAYRELKNAFRNREVEKIYHALVQGHPDPFAGTIDAPIGRNPGAKFKFAVIRGGKAAITHYETLEALPHASLLRVRLETGRTHQIRVHMAARHHPCVGDPLYGSDPHLAERLGLNRQWLHASELAFRHPGSGETMRFNSDYPPDLAHALALLR